MAFLLVNEEGAAGVAAGVEVLRDGGSALDAVEETLAMAESEVSTRTVGKNGRPNLRGVVELDAGIMDGKTLRTGAVGAVRTLSTPIRLARRVLEESPHELLVGEGADLFARECGLELSDPLTDQSREEWLAWLESEFPGCNGVLPANVPLSPHVPLLINPDETPRDTVIALAGDRKGDIAAGSSTSGWAYKYPGRVGDAPIAGAGFYCRNGVGAAACTHTGEMAIRANTAFTVVLAMKGGMAVDEACQHARHDLCDLIGGHLGPLSIFAVDSKGTPSVAGHGVDPSFFYWREGGTIAVQSTPNQAT